MPSPWFLIRVPDLFPPPFPSEARFFPFPSPLDSLPRPSRWTTSSSFSSSAPALSYLRSKPNFFYPPPPGRRPSLCFSSFRGTPVRSVPLSSAFVFGRRSRTLFFTLHFPSPFDRPRRFLARVLFFGDVGFWPVAFATRTRLHPRSSIC